jgi:hypothetical protein
LPGRRCRFPGKVRENLVQLAKRARPIRLAESLLQLVEGYSPVREVFLKKARDTLAFRVGCAE